LPNVRKAVKGLRTDAIGYPANRVAHASGAVVGSIAAQTTLDADP